MVSGGVLEVVAAFSFLDFNLACASFFSSFFSWPSTGALCQHSDLQIIKVHQNARRLTIVISSLQPQLFCLLVFVSCLSKTVSLKKYHK